MATRLISIDYIRQNTELNRNVDAKKINSNIYAAQTEYLEGKLGSNLLRKLYSLVEDGSITGATNASYKTLLDDYISLPLAYATLYLSSDHIYSQTNNKGPSKQTSEYSETLSLEELGVNRSFYVERFNSGFRTLYLYLLENSTSFPEFDSGNTDLNDKQHSDIEDLPFSW